MKFVKATVGRRRGVVDTDRSICTAFRSDALADWGGLVTYACTTHRRATSRRRASVASNVQDSTWKGFQGDVQRLMETLQDIYN